MTPQSWQCGMKSFASITDAANSTIERVKTAATLITVSEPLPTKNAAAVHLSAGLFGTIEFKVGWRCRGYTIKRYHQPTLMRGSFRPQEHPILSRVGIGGGSLSFAGGST